jgi:hypothetical protein
MPISSKLLRQKIDAYLNGRDTFAFLPSLGNSNVLGAAMILSFDVYTRIVPSTLWPPPLFKAQFKSAATSASSTLTTLARLRRFNDLW